MGIRLALAKGISAISTWGLKYVFRRPAANFPGKVALYVDPRLISDLKGKAARGSIIVCGTNGKTTVTNLLADALEAAGQTVVCNRTGANLDSGVATALLQAKRSDWGVFESDELWLAKILPHLKSDYLLLLNLFRDQLDRFAEIDYIQESIIAALEESPSTVLVYNADDPLCATIAEEVANASIGFGVAEDMHLTQNSVVDAQMCQFCSHMFEYEYRQYGQLGEFECPNCGFGRPALGFAAEDVKFGAQGLTFSVTVGDCVAAEAITADELSGAGSTSRSATAAGEAPTGAPAAEALKAAHEGLPSTIHAATNGAYMVYNLLATFAAARLLGCPAETFQSALDSFDPKNGRLETFDIQGRPVLLNLAKNPTGFNQNMKLILQDAGPKTVAFFVNDREGDGRDISWIWDVDFEELASFDGITVFAGGIRKNDLQVRLKYAGISSRTIERVSEAVEDSLSRTGPEGIYLIANYTALPAVRSEVAELAAKGASQ